MHVVSSNFQGRDYFKTIINFKEEEKEEEIKRTKKATPGGEDGSTKQKKDI